jgi:hypothetical protein
MILTISRYIGQRGEDTKPVLLEGYSIICKHKRVGCIELVERHTLVIQPKSNNTFGKLIFEKSA